MKIDINIPEEMCQSILDRYRYKTEVAKLYYNKYDYDELFDDKEKFGCVEKTLVYPTGARPNELDEEYPLVELLLEYEYDVVVRRLFNQWLFDMMYKFY